MLRFSLRGVFQAGRGEEMTKEQKALKPLLRDGRPPVGGWAPGGYLDHCRKCGKVFIGDKRATECADCAHGEKIEN